MTTVADVSYMVANHVGKLCDLTEITPEVASGPDSLTSRNNNQLSLVAMNNALLTMIEYLKFINTTNQRIFLVVIIVLIIVNIISYFLIYYLQFSRLQINRNQILLTLTTLPKTVISSVSASLNKLKDGHERTSSMMDSSADEETNRQEDSIIKLFASVSDGSANTSVEVSNFLCFLVVIVLGCIMYYVSMNAYRKGMKNLLYNSHHINYLYGSVSYIYSVMASIFKIALAKYDDVFANSIISLDDEIQNIGDRIPFLVSYFQMYAITKNMAFRLFAKSL